MALRQRKNMFPLNFFGAFFGKTPRIAQIYTLRAEKKSKMEND